MMLRPAESHHHDITIIRYYFPCAYSEISEGRLQNSLPIVTLSKLNPIFAFGTPIYLCKPPSSFSNSNFPSFA